MAYDESELNRLRKACPSRERSEDVRRIGLSLDGPDQELLVSVADSLLDVRHALRGGTRDVPGGRHWER